MKFQNYFPSAYIKSSDLTGDTVYQITHLCQEAVGVPPEQKLVVYFAGISQGLVLNKTNANTIASLYGEEMDGWTGKRVTLYPTEVFYQGKMSIGIRIRANAPAIGGKVALTAAPVLVQDDPELSADPAY